MPMAANDIVALVQKSLPHAHIEIKDLRGDNDHYHLTVVDPSFAGLSRAEQHKRVYSALGTHVGTTIHALSLTTREQP